MREFGRIVSSFFGVAKVVGLPQAMQHEVLLDEKGNDIGLVIGFDESSVDVLLFDEHYDPARLLYRGQAAFSIQVSAAHVGCVFDGLGRLRTGDKRMAGKRLPVFRPAPPIIDRQPVHEPLITGIKIIDATLPIGRGQRELIIGDRKLGKTTIALDTILNQAGVERPVVCVYVVCGQNGNHLEHVLHTLNSQDALEYTVVVAATENDSFAAQYLAPLVGCTIAEYFRDNGQDALIVYDDLSKHAKAYRDISLLLRRAPGREAYPGDIFSLHASLLERSAQLSKKRKGGSLTALPMVETQEGDITSYIPTNLISITDGQIYLENGLFQKGFLPAVNVGLSISRVGSEAQPPIIKEVTQNIRLVLAQQKELQKLTQLETSISETTSKKIVRGELTLELLKQDRHTLVHSAELALLLFALGDGLFDDIPKGEWHSFERPLLEYLRFRKKKLLQQLSAHSHFDDALKADARGAVAEFREEFSPKMP